MIMGRTLIFEGLNCLRIRSHFAPLHGLIFTTFMVTMHHLITSINTCVQRLFAWAVWCVCVCLCVGLVQAQAQTQSQAPTLTSHDVLQPARVWLDQSLMQVQGQQPFTLSVTLGQLDPRLQVAPCRQIEPSLPVGTRLWGKTRVALRCVDGVAKWQVFLPVQVKAMGLAWVVRRDVPAGASLSDDDLMMAEVDWADDPSPVVTQAQTWANQVTARALTTGQTLRQNLLRPAQVFQPGSLVRVMAQGGGFQVSSDGQALGAGVVGQAVKVRMDNGRVMTGTVVDARTVKVDI